MNGGEQRSIFAQSHGQGADKAVSGGRGVNGLDGEGCGPRTDGFRLGCFSDQGPLAAQGDDHAAAARDGADFSRPGGRHPVNGFRSRP